MARAGDENGRQRIAVRIGIIGEYARCGNRQSGVFIGAVEIVVGNREIVDRIDGDVHGGDVAVQETVVRLVTEAVRTVVVGVGVIGECTVGIERERAVARASDEDGG